MLKKFGVAVAAGVATVALAACGAYDTADAVKSFNDEINSTIQSALSSAGITGVAATEAGVKLSCPNDVQKEEAFTCTVTGNLSGESADVKMEINSSDELAPVDESAFAGEITRFTESESIGAAAGEAAAN